MATGMRQDGIIDEGVAIPPGLSRNAQSTFLRGFTIPDLGFQVLRVVSLHLAVVWSQSFR